MDSSDKRLSRRAVLTASGGAVGLLGAGTGRASAGLFGGHERCPEATFRPNTVPYEKHGDCSDDHPATRELQERVSRNLRKRFPTVGSLIDAGFIPYFDFATANRGDGWSHWLNPTFVGDGTAADPKRPASVLVDHRWWRPIGVMFVATRDGHRVDPPAAYRDEDGEKCSPWHAHTGLPGRYAWWKYRRLYVDWEGDETDTLPCRTPWVMHVWRFTDEGIYAHDAPPRGERGGPPAEPAGFETDAVPGEDPLSLKVLPDALAHKVKRL
ncbi:MAG: hypothetical protein ABEJ06_01550 [Haloarculaceae archaeon]